MRKSSLLFELILIVFTVFFNCCEKDEEEDILPPDCNIITPADSSEFQLGDSIIINVEAEDQDGVISAVLYYIDDVGKYSTKVLPYQFKWPTSNETIGFHVIKATALDRSGNSSSDECAINLVVRPPVVITANVSSITHNSAVSGGNVTNDGGDTITARGVCWSTSPDPTLDNANGYTADSAGTGFYTSFLTGLSRTTTYYVRAYATNSEGISYGEQVMFFTEPTSLVVATSPVTNITSASAVCGGEVTDDGGLPVTERGICWNTTGEPTLSNNHTINGTGTGSFTSSITGLSYNTKYYIRAYATNSNGLKYGNTISFTTDANLPTVITTKASLITCNSAQSGGNITNDGGAHVTAKGLCWSTYSNPTILDNVTNDGTGKGSFKANISGLSHSMLYYARAYAINSVGTAYGNTIQFTTSPPDVPTLETKPISNITSTTALGGGEITTDGCTPVYVRGICWNTSSYPAITDYKTNNGTGTGSFISNITGLESGTTYYVRAYATNNKGTSYGNQVNFKTGADLPTVITIIASSITNSSAQSGGNIIDDNGATITAKGLCWSTSAYPTIYDNKTNEGSGTESFISTMTGLESGTTYYVRAYATNSIGTAYGNEIEFSTLTYLSCPDAPTVSDYDGNVYRTVQIGGQCWMKENLKTTHYSDGSPLVDGAGLIGISLDYTTKYCFDYNDDPVNTDTYGKLYTWAAVMNEASSSDACPSGVQGVCPTGWHIPSNAEWKKLVDYLGGPDIAGGKLKEAGTVHWRSPNMGATDESGFTALPNGWRAEGEFGGIRGIAYLWSSTKSYFDNAFSLELINDHENAFDSFGYPFDTGQAVRCIKD